MNKNVKCDSCSRTYEHGMSANLVCPHCGSRKYRPAKDVRNESSDRKDLTESRLPQLLED